MLDNVPECLALSGHKIDADIKCGLTLCKPSSYNVRLPLRPHLIPLSPAFDVNDHSFYTFFTWVPESTCSWFLPPALLAVSDSLYIQHAGGKTLMAANPLRRIYHTEPMEFGHFLLFSAEPL